jgi:hypothetical protein
LDRIFDYESKDWKFKSSWRQLEEYMGLYVLGYFIIAAIVFGCILAYKNPENEDTMVGVFFCSLIWPVSIIVVLSYFSFKLILEYIRKYEH